MPTVENPSEQPEREYPEPMPVIDERALRGNGFYIMRRMYQNPYEAICSWGTDEEHREWVNKVAELFILGYVGIASTGDGFQLTAKGRLVFHEYLQRIEREETLRYTAPPAEEEGFFWSSYTASELAMLDDAYGDREQPFDLLDF